LFWIFLFSISPVIIWFYIKFDSHFYDCYLLFSFYFFNWKFLFIKFDHHSFTTRNSLNTNGFTDGIFLSVFWGWNYRRPLSVCNSVCNYGRKIFRILKKGGSLTWRFWRVIFFRRNHRRIQNDSPYSARTVMRPVRRLNYRRTHRGIWNGKSVRWRVYVSVRITNVITDGVSVGETVGKS
jgi:hypothetical protein